MRICTKCGAEKDTAQFYPNPKSKDGIMRVCKACMLEYKSKFRSRADQKAKDKLYRSAHALEHNLYKREYRARNGNKAKESRLFKETHLVKRRAHEAVWRAVRSGKLLREPCEVCGSAEVEAHHDDHTKPLIVRWLCRLHHSELHKRLALPERPYGQNKKARAILAEIEAALPKPESRDAR